MLYSTAHFERAIHTSKILYAHRPHLSLSLDLYLRISVLPIDTYLIQAPTVLLILYWMNTIKRASIPPCTRNNKAHS